MLKRQATIMPETIRESLKVGEGRISGGELFGLRECDGK